MSKKSLWFLSKIARCKLDMHIDMFDCICNIYPTHYPHFVAAIPAPLSYGTPASREDLDVLDAFSGHGEVTAAFRVDPWVLE